MTMLRFTLWSFTLGWLLTLVPPAGATPSAEEAGSPVPEYPLDPEIFPLAAELRPNFHFWMDIFTRYGRNDVVLHDEDHVEIIYKVLHFEGSGPRGVATGRERLARRKAIQEAYQETRSHLYALAGGHDLEDRGLQLQLEAAFSHVPGGPRKYRDAARRLRTQTGLKEEFAEGIRRSGRFMPAMEEHFKERGMPVELTRIPFVESMFQTRARSKVGAGGIWQMMPATAKGYVRMGMEVDERYDPLLATEGAAQILEENYRDLQSWPLAITAYNYGKYGMMRAVRNLGTRDLGQIVRKHRTRIFGFASKNFYTEVVAAATVYHHRDRYFPGVEPAPPMTFEELTPDRYVAAPDLAAAAGADRDALKTLNPALSPQVWNGDLFIPQGYRLRVPAGQGERFRTAYGELPDSAKSDRQAGFRHRIRSGETLSAIAHRYGTSVAAIQRANDLRSAHRIRSGQTLLIPPSRSSARRPAAVATAAPPSDGIHVVRSGETLSTIAQRYGTTVNTLTALNGLADSHRIHVGQRLAVTGGTGAGARHIVRPGETLAAIARLYSTTVAAIQRANSIPSHIIHPRQVLIIP